MLSINESTTDRIIRVILALALGAAAFTTLSGAWQLIAGVIAVVLVVTAAIGFCPLYRILGMSTCPVPSATRRP